MFMFASSLKELDVSNWDTSRVANMGVCLCLQATLTELDVSNWDTSRVTNMWSMFNGASNLTELDVSNWDTSNVTTMESMFHGASNLTELDVSNWDTSNVTHMWGMFHGASNLTELDVSNWDTSRVTNMGSMFNAANFLRQLTMPDSFFITGGNSLGGIQLPPVPQNEIYTGRWQNVGEGSARSPLGYFVLTSAELVAENFAGRTVGDTWVWQRIVPLPTIRTSSQLPLGVLGRVPTTQN